MKSKPEVQLAEPAHDDSSENSPTQLRRFIDEQVGGIQKLLVPDNDQLPQPRLPDGTLTSDPRFQTTEAKRYLGKLTFFDPVTTARIIPSFGGVLATRQTGSCGSCHLGEVREIRHAHQPQRGRRGAVLHGRRREPHSTPAAPRRHSPAPAGHPSFPWRRAG